MCRTTTRRRTSSRSQTARTSRWVLAGLAGVVVAAAGGWAFHSSTASNTGATQGSGVVKSLRVDVIRAFPHDPTAYTQGLLWWDGKLYESTGQYGESTLRRVDPQTGEVEQRINITPAYFGEGLAQVDGRLIVLTWKAERAFVYDLETFDQLRTFRYRGEGWGLCHDGTRLVMSNGSDALTFYNPKTFEEIGSLRVTLRGQPLTSINELECVGDEVYANVWERNFIVRIDLDSGRVTDLIDAAGLLNPTEARGVDVLNGIAHSPESNTFYITGKWWPTMFEVRFIE